MIERNQAARREDTAKEAGLYVAFELSRKKWKLGISDGKTTRARVVSIEAQDWKRTEARDRKSTRTIRIGKGRAGEELLRSGTGRILDPSGAGRNGNRKHCDRRGIDGCEAEEEGEDGSDRCGGAGEAIDSILARRTGRLERGAGAQRGSGGQPADASGDGSAQAGEGAASGADPVVVVYGRAGRGSELGIDEATGSAMPWMERQAVREGMKERIGGNMSG